MILAQATLLLLAATTRQDLTTKVNYKTVAVPAAKAIADIAKQTKIDIVVIAPLDKEPIIVNLKDVPLKDAMDKIADVLDGKWVQQGKAFTLQRPDEMQQKLLDDRTADKGAKIAAAQKKILDQSPLKPLDEAALRDLISKLTVDVTAFTSVGDESRAKMIAKRQEIMKYETQVGSQRLCREVLAILDPQQLATDPYPENIVLSNDPKPLERKLEISDNDLRQIAEEQNLWFKLTKDIENDASAMFLDGSELERAIDPNDLRIIASVQVDDGSFNMSVTLVNSKNELYLTAQDYLNATDPSLTGQVPAPPTKEATKPNPYAKYGFAPIPLSAEAQEMRVLIGALEKRRTGAVVRAAKKEMQDLLMDSLNHDPLSWAPSEVILGIADQKHWNVVARLTDRDIIAAGSETLTKSDPANFLFLRENSTNIAIKDGWLTIAPKDILDMERTRTDRATLARYARAIQQTGYSTIDAEADFYAGNVLGVDPRLAATYAILIHPDSDPFGDGSYINNDPAAMRLYGLLGTDQREQIQQGKPLQTNQLNDEQREAFTQLIMEPPTPDYVDLYLQSQSAALTDAAPVKTEYDDPSTLPAAIEKYEDEPLEVLETNTPGNAMISARVASGHGLKAKYNIVVDPAKSETYTIEEWIYPELGMDPGGPGPGSEPTYAWGDKREIHFAIKISDKISITTLFTEHKNNLSMWGPASKLPQELQKALEDAKAARRGYEGMSDDDDSPDTGAAPPRV